MKTKKLNEVLQVEELEARIAPDVSGTGGYDGHPGGQANAHVNPSGSVNPESSANPENSESGPKKGKG